MIPAPRTLHVDRDALPSRAGARSLEEALSRLVADEYDTIVLHTRTAGSDDYGLVTYLAGTWPQFLRAITLRSVCGAASHVWNAPAGRFEREPSARARDRLDGERAVVARSHPSQQRATSCASSSM